MFYKSDESRITRKTRSIIMLHILFRGNLAKNGLLTQISHQKLR